MGKKTAKGRGKYTPHSAGVMQSGLQATQSDLKPGLASMTVAGKPRHFIVMTQTPVGLGNLLDGLTKPAAPQTRSASDNSLPDLEYTKKSDEAEKAIEKALGSDSDNGYVTPTELVATEPMPENETLILFDPHTLESHYREMKAGGWLGLFAGNSNPEPTRIDSIRKLQDLRAHLLAMKEPSATINLIMAGAYLSELQTIGNSYKQAIFSKDPSASKLYCLLDEALETSGLYAKANQEARESALNAYRDSNFVITGFENKPS